MTARRTQQLRIHAVSEARPRWTRCHRSAAGLLLTGAPGRVTCKACLMLLRADRPLNVIDGDEIAFVLDCSPPDIIPLIPEGGHEPRRERIEPVDPYTDPYSAFPEGTLAVETVRRFLEEKAERGPIRGVQPTMTTSTPRKRTPEEQQFLKDTAHLVDRPRTTQEENLWIAQAQEIGDLPRHDLVIDFTDPANMGGKWLQPIRDAAEKLRRAARKQARKPK